MYEHRIASIFRESSFTLSHKRSCTYTFSRADRFRNSKRPVGSEFVLLPSTLTNRGTTQGFGKRYILKNIEGRDSPPPGTYNLPSTFNYKIGPKFKKDSPMTFTKILETTPGPGSYEMSEMFTKIRNKFNPKILLEKEFYTTGTFKKARYDSPALTNYQKKISFHK